MTSPLLNEDLVCSMLGTTPSAAEGNTLRTSALLVLMDSYDRKVVRDTFFETAKAALQLTEMMGRLESVSGVRASLAAGTLTDTKLDGSMGIITGHAETCRKNLIHAMALLIQCSDDEDTLN